MNLNEIIGCVVIYLIVGLGPLVMAILLKCPKHEFASNMSTSCNTPSG